MSNEMFWIYMFGVTSSVWSLVTMIIVMNNHKKWEKR